MLAESVTFRTTLCVGTRSTMAQENVFSLPRFVINAKSKKKLICTRENFWNFGSVCSLATTQVVLDL